MPHTWLKRKKKLRDALVHFTDFVRYTFTPAFGFVMLTGATCCLMIMAVLHYRFQPLIAVVIVIGYNGVVCMVMIFSLLGYRNYKKRPFK